MPFSRVRAVVVRAAVTLVTAAAALFPAPSHAVLKCQELVDQRSCTDNSPHTFVYNGASVSVPAPTMSGFPSPCWSWNRQFQCVETNPSLWCDSGDSYSTVQNTCSLTGAAINGTITVNGVTYITNATYDYACAFGNYTTNDSLPQGKDCTQLSSTTTDSNTVPSAPPGSNPASTPLTGSTSLTETRDDQYVCYSPPQTVCTDTCYEQVVDPSTGQMQQKEVACQSPVTNCVASASQCTGTLTKNADGTFSSQQNLGPDGRCIDSTTQQMCQSGPVPKCLTKSNCTLTATAPSSVQSNGVATGQTQTYTCTNQTTSCTQVTNVSNCVHANAWGWDDLNLKSQVGQGLGEANEALAKVEGIQKGVNNNDPYIFSGQNLKCHYAVGNFLNTFITIAVIAVTMIATGGSSAGLLATVLQSQAVMGTAAMTAAAANATAIAIQVGASAAMDAPNSKAFGNNCCKDYVIEGSDAWYKLGSCTADEVKLAVSKQKGLDHYLGEYCSKKAGFPLRQCVEMSKSYCVFDDMLALVVNEQGRQQLDAIAAADTTTTKATGDMGFPLYTPAVQNPTGYKGVLNNGHWVKLTAASNSQVWAWQYPNYCSSTDAQTAAYNLYLNEVNQAVNQQGIQPSKMTPQQAGAIIAAAINEPPFQECPSTAGTVSFMTCDKQDDSCDPTALPTGPSGVETDISGANVSQADVNWQIQQVQSFYKPGDYGVTSSMASDSTFAAVSNSVNSFITATGSCHTDGSCLYNFAITDKQATNGLGAKKRTTDHAQFPLYAITPTTVYPAITYLSQDGTLNTVAYQADPNRGLGSPLAVSTQRFIFHPNLLTKPLQGNIHSKVLLEWASHTVSAFNPANDYTPLLVPTNLPPATPGWYPYGDPSDNGNHFYLSGGCDPNSRWCNYEIDIDLTIQRHPWGSPQDPQCWGFTIQQMAALDFSKMDLSKWINSLDLGATTTGLTQQEATAMTNQATATAQAFYNSYATGAATTKPGASMQALVTNTDTLPKLSNDNFQAYTLQAAVPSNWPQYFDDRENNNPVTNIKVDWGDGKQSGMQLQTDPSTGKQRGYLGTHDYGDDPVGTYKVTVTLNTANNGPQTLTTNVRITPDKGGTPASPTTLDFNNPGIDAAQQGTYVPSQTANGINTAPGNLQSLSPGTVQQFNNQGSSVTTTPYTPTPNP